MRKSACITEISSTHHLLKKCTRVLIGQQDFDASAVPKLFTYFIVQKEKIMELLVISLHKHKHVLCSFMNFAIRNLVITCSSTKTNSPIGM